LRVYVRVSGNAVAVNFGDCPWLVYKNGVLYVAVHAYWLYVVMVIRVNIVSDQVFKFVVVEFREYEWRAWDRHWSQG
jgi:hypothetical protein